MALRLERLLEMDNIILCYIILFSNGKHSIKISLTSCM